MITPSSIISIFSSNQISTLTIQPRDTIIIIYFSADAAVSFEPVRGVIVGAI